MRGEPALAAIDLGAESGRVVIGRPSAGSLTLEEIHRFTNRPVQLPNGVHWNLMGLFAGLLGVTMGSVPPRYSAIGRIPVHAVAPRDTASAFVAAPITSPGAAILSSGTCSLVGVESDTPLLTSEAAAYNLSNERGVDGTIRLLANVMGLWLVQQCRRVWDRADYGELTELGARAPADVPVLDPDDQPLLALGEMPGRIAARCGGLAQRSPETRGEIIRSALTSLACKFRLVLERLERVTGREVDALHVLGGGARNALLCQLAADITGREVIAGPVEATAAASAELATYDAADDRQLAESTNDRFLRVTGLGEPGASLPARS